MEMDYFGRTPILRQAAPTDAPQLQKLLRRKSFILRHLDWHSPLSWLGKQPFFLQEVDEGEILAALACPPDAAGLIWLRLFAAAPGFSPQQAWQALWPAARDWLKENLPTAQVNSLAVSPQVEELLVQADFKEISQVVSLVWDIGSARWPDGTGSVEVREMAPDDLPQVFEIDLAAFDPLWRNTLDELQAAFSVSSYASVGLVEGRVSGYQISTASSQGGHLARLAVSPDLQGKGIGVTILDDLLERFTRAGIVEVSVNTQRDNQRSLALYQKFGFKLLEGIYPVFCYRVDPEEAAR
ncbi:MAG: GNAT family N-acetyltransferase [Anaerolineales bacterium]